MIGGGELTRRMDKLNFGINKQGEFYENTKDSAGKTTKTYIGNDRAVKKLTRAHGRFRMELLSVMFFGMALSKTFGGMIKGALDMMGVMDMLSAAIFFLMLPIAMFLLPYILWVVKEIFKLDESTRMIIGTIVLVLAIIGTILMVIGMVGLGLGGLITFLTPVLAHMALVKVILSFLAANIIIFIAIIALVALGVAKNWTFIEKHLNAAIQFVNDMIYGIKLILQGFLMIVEGIFSGNWDLVKEGLDRIWNGIKIFLSGFIGFQLEIVQIAFGIVAGIGGVVTDFLKWVFHIVDDFTGGLLKRALDAGANFVQGLIDGITGALGGFGDILGNVGSSIGIPNFGSMLGFAKGGIVPGPLGRPMPAIVHGGEAVIPAGSRTGEINITNNISATINNDMDINALVDEINDKMSNNLRRVGIR